MEESPLATPQTPDIRKVPQRKFPEHIEPWFASSVRSLLPVAAPGSL